MNKLKKGDLFRNPVDLVLDVLDDSQNGLIPKNELKKAVVKVAKENSLEIDDQSIAKIVDTIYQSDNGTKTTKASRKSIRQALSNL